MGTKWSDFVGLKAEKKVYVATSSFGLLNRNCFRLHSLFKVSSIGILGGYHGYVGESKMCVMHFMGTKRKRCGGSQGATLREISTCPTGQSSRRKCCPTDKMLVRY